MTEDQRLLYAPVAAAECELPSQTSRRGPPRTHGEHSEATTGENILLLFCPGLVFLLRLCPSRVFAGEAAGVAQLSPA